MDSELGYAKYRFRACTRPTVNFPVNKRLYITESQWTALDEY